MREVELEDELCLKHLDGEISTQRVNLLNVRALRALLADLLREVVDRVGAGTIAGNALADCGVRHLAGENGWDLSVVWGW